MKALSLYPRLNYKLTFAGLIALAKSVLNVDSSVESVVSSIYKGKRPYFFNNGRSGLLFILRLFPQAKRVAVQPYTCLSVLEAIVQAGCSIVFLDINNSLTIDLNDLKHKIDKIDIIIVTHIYGSAAAMSEIIDIAKDKILIEDCAHAFYSEDNSNELLGLKGTFSFFSHGFAKFPSAISGGFVFVNDKRYIEKFDSGYIQLDKESRVVPIKNIFRAIGFSILHQPHIYKFLTKKIKSSRKTESNNNIQIKKLSISNLHLFRAELQDIVLKRKVQRDNMNTLLSSIKNNHIFVSIEHTENTNGFMLALIVDNPERMIHYMLEHGIEVGQHFRQTYFIAPQYGYIKGNCPYYESIIDKIVVLPTHYNYPERVIRKMGGLLMNYN